MQNRGGKSNREKKMFTVNENLIWDSVASRGVGGTYAYGMGPGREMCVEALNLKNGGRQKPYQNYAWISELRSPEIWYPRHITITEDSK